MPPLYAEVPMPTEHQSLADIPMWAVILIALAGLAGEMRQAEMAGITLGEILRRVLLRWSSSALFGMATLLIVLSMTRNPILSGALGIVVGLLGADIAGALYSRWLAKRAGVDKADGP